MKISKNLALIKIRSDYTAQGANKFLDAEEAYSKLSQAKNLDKFNNFIERELKNNGEEVKLDAKMHEEYLKQIMENGGAPSLKELQTFAVDIEESQQLNTLMQILQNLFQG